MQNVVLIKALMDLGAMAAHGFTCPLGYIENLCEEQELSDSEHKSIINHYQTIQENE